MVYIVKDGNCFDYSLEDEVESYPVNQYVGLCLFLMLSSFSILVIIILNNRSNMKKQMNIKKPNRAIENQVEWHMNEQLAIAEKNYVREMRWRKDSSTSSSTERQNRGIIPRDLARSELWCLVDQIVETLEKRNFDRDRI